MVNVQQTEKYLFCAKFCKQVLAFIKVKDPDSLKTVHRQHNSLA